MRVLVAPDKFKGSLSSREAAQAIERGVKRAQPDAEVVVCPLADGGEGTVEALITATGGKLVHRKVLGPLGTEIDSYFATLGSRVRGQGSSAEVKGAVVEMSAASGLHLVPASARNPMLTTTFGTGQLVMAVLDKKCGLIVVGIGGSATTDGGMGMAQALGAKFLDRYDKELPLGCGRELKKVERIDASGLDGRIEGIDFLVASDVQNPLTGPDGAAHIYAPQKGATPEMVEELDEALEHYADVIKRDLGIDIRDVPGAGAAGGLGAGLIVFTGAEIKSGVALVMEAVGFSEQLARADLVITGEGKIDAQTAYGKVVAGVGQRAKGKGIPVIAIGGQVGPDAEILKDLGLKGLYSLVKPGVTVEEAIKNAAQLLEDATAEALKS